MPSNPMSERLLEQYGCGPIRFTGSGDALYERHLMFDRVVDPATIGARERYEAAAHSVRDVVSQRWLAMAVWGAWRRAFSIPWPR